MADESIAVDVDPAHVIVVVPALNEAQHIADCLQSLASSDPFMANVRIVVADGGSTDGTQAVVEELRDRCFPNLSLIDNLDRLQSAGLNAAVDRCAGPEHTILVRCDAHAVYPEGYVRRVAAALEARPEAASVATVMDARGECCFARAAAWVVDTPLGSGGSAHRGGTRSGWVDHGHHAGFRLSWFRQIGGYDSSFSHNEDAEYDVRLGRVGGRVWLAADIRLGYLMRDTPRKLARQYWNYGCGRARTVHKHHLRPKLRQLAPAVNMLLLLLTGLWATLWPPALAYPLAYLMALAAVSLIGVVSLRSVCGVFAGPALGILQMAWGAGFLSERLAALRGSAHRPPNTSVSRS
ncbi:hypothetical protein OCH239_17125 [Roseivivax halodurans JCM 10272]|uniref:Glycosyltransferase 2-like domain-containing protein n=1 Tax=Roseivivax halodurans JCM 10272 TaxID=1449350 RepID=X7EA08_9RHOB|nr:glycosyltransferase family 2 protein [Roseivivax halodurans]ETX12787.1 hypothetical protein OCH239_17125 [Roseivivax halodurans JCM 10272]